MSNQIAVVEQATFSNRQLEIMRRTVASGTSAEDFALFLEVCKHRNLNPFNREIYAIMRQNKMTIQVSIDGLRILAERSGKYAGQIGPQWCGKDGVWLDVWLDDAPPVAARVGILRKDFEQPTWGVAKFKSYVQQSSATWQKMPDVMIAKCAESLALRKAFPGEMGGLYTHEEMQQADSVPLPVVTVSPTQPSVETIVTEVVESEPPAEMRKPAPKPAPSANDDDPIAEQQKKAIRNLCQRLGQDVPAELDTMTVSSAKQAIAELSAAIRALPKAS